MNYRNNKLFKITFWIFVGIPTILFVLVTLSYFVFLLWPYDLTKVTSFPINQNVTHLTIMAHGVKDSPANWSDSLRQEMKQRAATDSQIVSLDWRPFSNNPLTCSMLAKNIGEEIAERILKNPEIKSVHAIGHSCGSFVAYGLCKTVKQLNSDIKVHTTYLDPVSIYAGIFWDYGIERFGDCADFSDAYIDTEDTVPGSNQALENTYTFDVTQIRIKQKNQQPPHNWPPHFYIQASKENRLPMLDVKQSLVKHSKFVKGKLIVLE